MPQWDFLNFFAEEAKRYPSFRLLTNTEATDLLVEDGWLPASAAKSPQGPLAIRAGVTVAADGRQSILRQRAGLESIHLGAPMDVLWMRISRAESDPPITLGRVDFAESSCCSTAALLAVRSHHSQGRLRRPSSAWLARVSGTARPLAPFLRDRVAEFTDWDQIKLLTVIVDRLKRWWRPGLLCIGDSAHAMSPIGASA